MNIYHYTCDHHVDQIVADGFLRPGPDGLIWLTDLEPPAPRRALGLTSYMLDCDRMAHCFEAAPHGVEPWIVARKRFPQFVNHDKTPGAMPMHWFLAEAPVQIIRKIPAGWCVA